MLAAAMPATAIVVAVRWVAEPRLIVVDPADDDGVTLEVAAPPGWVETLPRHVGTEPCPFAQHRDELSPKKELRPWRS
jgi:hypothetical protein